MLAEPDPRAPVSPGGQKPYVARTLVRINHLQNCLLCHPPATARALAADKSLAVLTREVGQDLSAYLEAKARNPDLLVRADVTYLRQDFSLVQYVPGADPVMQRFDYVVCTRLLTDKEARAYQAELHRAGPSPYREAALTALRVLEHNTGAGLLATACWLALGCTCPILLCCLIHRFRRWASKVPHT